MLAISILRAMAKAEASGGTLMSAPTQKSLQETIRLLKDIVTSLKGEEHESARIVRQMESIASDIERKARGSKSLAHGASKSAPVSAAV